MFEIQEKIINLEGSKNLALYITTPINELQYCINIEINMQVDLSQCPAKGTSLHVHPSKTDTPDCTSVQSDQSLQWTLCV